MATFENFSNDPINFVKDGINRNDPTVIGVLVGVAVVIFTILLLAILRGGRNTRRGLLLVGLCDSGKTLLFSRLVYKAFKSTHTSINVNDGSYTVPTEKGGVLNILDVPGHERIRPQLVDKYKDTARAIVFMVDSLTFSKELKDVAECLYNLLTDKVISSNRTPIVVACNKQDITMAKGSKVIKSQLEKEMNKVRVSRSAALQGQDNSSNSVVFLGKKNKEFEFSDLKGLKVEFVECSCKGLEDSDGDLKELYEWIEKIA